jgi:cardiolipin synthase
VHLEIFVSLLLLDRVELQNGDQIFPAMLDAIRAARTSINLESFIWSSGKVSTQFVDA